MNFPATCPHCARSFETEYLDSSIHRLTCPHCGKPFVLFVRKHRFEMLFDLGTRALLAGFTREAVANFAAALERGFEFYLRAALLERAAQEGRDLGTVSRELEATWKLLIVQSERQLGAFAAAYFSREARAPDFLTPQSLMADFRNRVIHRGYLPRREEVDAYAARCYALLGRLLNDLGEAALQVVVLQEREFAAVLDQLPDDVPAVFEEHPGMFRQSRTQAPQLPAAPLNDAAAFEWALRERGSLVSRLFEKRTDRS